MNQTIFRILQNHLPLACLCVTCEIAFWIVEYQAWEHCLHCISLPVCVTCQIAFRIVKYQAWEYCLQIIKFEGKPWIARIVSKLWINCAVDKRSFTFPWETNLFATSQLAFAPLLKSILMRWTAIFSCNASKNSNAMYIALNYICAIMLLKSILMHWKI